MHFKISKIPHPFSGIGKKIESKVRKALFDFSMLQNIQSLAVALSGGKDSLCMLFMLKAILGRGFDRIDLSAIHVDGDFSCGASYERKFLKDLCDDLEIKIYFENLKNNFTDLDCYVCARERRKIIFDIAKKNNIHTIAFGHHRDDNIETLLMNLFHKAEFEGMLPVIKFKKFNVTIIRPLIYVEENEIINFAKHYQILKTFCKCSIGQISKRKEVKKIIDEIQKKFPNIKSNLSKASFNYGSKKALCN
jgi:tRNA 2-thiocytidine biosynthesis protein TtcA